MPRLDEKTQRARRETILDAAESCFTRQGFHQTSMQDICREAGISPGALYLYFTSKEDLIAGICEREKGALAEALASVGEADDFFGALGRLAQTYCLNEPRDKMRLHLEINAEAMRNPKVGHMVRAIDKFVLDSFERLLGTAAEKGQIEPVEDFSKIALVISMIGDGLFLRRAIDPEFDGEACLPVILTTLSTLIRPVLSDGGHDVQNAAKGQQGLGAQNV